MGKKYCIVTLFSQMETFRKMHINDKFFSFILELCRYENVANLYNTWITRLRYLKLNLKHS